jgi:cation channel sperm-associated protein 3
MLTIFTNAIFIAVETSSAAGAHGDLFVVVDIVFLVIYTIEFVLKVFCEPRDYWASNYNRFDFLILIQSMFSFTQLVLKSDSGIFSNLAYIRILRGK